ncbi:MAG: hypothetical protein JWO67_3281, partial [Streptosporangiaceae bacterium]|nr:hypothetical protein [Streptosporangiaceae bacterium]
MLSAQVGSFVQEVPPGIAMICVISGRLEGRKLIRRQLWNRVHRGGLGRLIGSLEDGEPNRARPV